jgi:aspartyl-tRNA(Asn)/glutamyl-tRNA(Gln) amidotransferase subunit A
METLCWLEAFDLSSQYASRALNPSDVVDSVFRRIESCEPKLNALFLKKRDSAKARANESAAQWRAGGARSLLEGVPITIKENLYSIGDPAPIGTGATSLEPKTVSSPVVDRVLEAGLVVVGKTTMPDFGMLTSGQSSFHGTTCNPWQLDTGLSTSAQISAAPFAYRRTFAAFTGLNPRWGVFRSIRLFSGAPQAR